MGERHGPPLTVERQYGEADGRVGDQTQSHTFGDMAKDYEFFTTALIITHGKFDRDPLAEFIRLNPSDTAGQPFAIDYPPQPFFKGIGSYPLPGVTGQLVNWDHRLYAIVRERWNDCRNFILGIAFMNPKERTYTRINCHEVELLDPIAVTRGKPMAPPTFYVTVFGVSSTHHLTYLQPMGRFERPVVHVDPPHEEVQVEGFAVLGPPPSPDKLLEHLHERALHETEGGSAEPGGASQPGCGS